MSGKTFKPGSEDFVYNTLLRNKPLEEQIDLYNETADTYDKDCESCEYFFPQILCREFATFKLPSNTRILDVGAGTGLNGKQLHDFGYNNIDALDGSENMLKHARRLTNVYSNFIQALVVKDKELPIAANTYDVALMAGSASPAHIDVNAYPQIIRVVKPGGIIGWILEDKDTCEKVNEKFLENAFQKTLDGFVRDKLWVPVDGYNPKRLPNALLGRPGDVYFYKVL